MTPDEQEALSFRYIAPRIMFLSSGNIAIIPMIGRRGVTIVEPQNFYDLQSYIPHPEELERQYEDAETAMRARLTKHMPPKPTKASLDDLA